MAIINTLLGGADASDGDVLYAAGLNDTFNVVARIGKIQEIYTGTGFDSTFNSSTDGSDSDNHELTAIAAADLVGSNYLNIKILAYVENHATSGSAGGSCSVSLKIETKDVGGAYSDTLPTQTIASAVAYDDRNQEYGIRTYEWLHTLTNDEKANGVQVKITSSCSVDAGTATTNYTEFKNVQTVLTTE